MGELEDALNRLKEVIDHPPSNRVRAAIIAGSGFAVAALLVVVDYLLDLPEKIEAWLRAHIVSSNDRLASQTQPQPMLPLELKWLAWLVIIGFIVVVVSVVAAFIFWLWSRRDARSIRTAGAAAQVSDATRKEVETARDGLLADKQRLEATTQDLLRSNQQLTLQLATRSEDFFTDFSANVTQIKNSGVLTRLGHVKQDTTRFRIDDEGQLFVTVTRKLTAADVPLSFLLSGAACSPDGLKNFRDINLEVQSNTDHTKLVYIPAINEPNRKEFFIVLLPELQPGSNLDYTVSWSWPKAMKDLLDRGQDSVLVPLKSKSVIEHVLIVVEIHEKLGPVSIKNNGYGDGKLDQAWPTPYLGYRTYNWRIQNCEPQLDKEVVLEITRLKV